ncbi:HSP20-like chaperone [Rhypophila decipiens]|uniref:HSP20-like chaperone n=1 Tax=Rhypophila decipiens TaxID=261697 RepID=A0AAN6XVG7_9PEZI|nr:HSP20-like chaperone [Rhypophila decipiens]
MASPFFSTNSYDPSFHPLFRLLSDFDAYSRETKGLEGSSSLPERRASRPLAPKFDLHETKPLTPKFDLHETKETYELHGELPGFDRDNVHIEFTDHQTILISGQVERSYSSSTAPGNLIQDGKKTEAITETGEDHKPHKASVEDEESAAAKKNGAEKSNGVSNVVKHKDQKKTSEPTEKVWVSERSFGQFQRQFSFPSPIDQDAVKASLKDGILSVSIPKAQPKKGGRRIAIN